MRKIFLMFSSVPKMTLLEMFLRTKSQKDKSEASKEVGEPQESVCLFTLRLTLKKYKDIYIPLSNKTKGIYRFPRFPFNYKSLFMTARKLNVEFGALMSNLN